MNFDFHESILASGFNGGLPISELQESSCSAIPKERGVYLVVRHATAPVSFVEASCGTHLKNRDPSVPLQKLHDRWIPDSKVLYVGKAGGTGQKTTLYGRLKSYLEYGQGMQRTHWGGRYIWQLADVKSLQVYWAIHAEAEPAHVESSLIRELERRHGRLPFANLRR